MRSTCGAKTRAGGLCASPPVTGAERCRMHGGRTEKAKARAQAQRAMKALGDVPAENVDPAEALLRLVSMKWAETLWLRSKVRDIPDEPSPKVQDDGEYEWTELGDGLTYGLTKYDTGVGPEGPIDKRTYESEANIWWRLLREAEDQLAKYSTAALRAGVERRQLELQEAQAVHLATAINRILDALELTAEQARRAPEIVTTTLRALPVEGGK